MVALGLTRSCLHGWGYLVPSHAKPRQCRGLCLSGPQWDTEASADIIGGDFCKWTGYRAVDRMEDHCEGGAGGQPLHSRGARQAACRGPLGGAGPQSRPHQPTVTRGRTGSGASQDPASPHLGALGAPLCASREVGSSGHRRQNKHAQFSSVALGPGSVLGQMP